MSDNEYNLVRKVFVGRQTAILEAINFVAELIERGDTYGSCDVIGNTTIQVNYYDNRESVETKTPTIELKQPEPLVFFDEEPSDSGEDDTEVVETTIISPDWEHAESLENKTDVEAYLAEFGFNATSTWKKATMIKKAKEYFGE